MPRLYSSKPHPTPVERMPLHYDFSRVGRFPEAEIKRALTDAFIASHGIEDLEINAETQTVNFTAQAASKDTLDQMIVSAYSDHLSIHPVDNFFWTFNQSKREIYSFFGLTYSTILWPSLNIPEYGSNFGRLLENRPHLTDPFESFADMALQLVSPFFMPLIQLTLAGFLLLGTALVIPVTILALGFLSPITFLFDNIVPYAPRLMLAGVCLLLLGAIGAVVSSIVDPLLESFSFVTRALMTFSNLYTTPSSSLRELDEEEDDEEDWVTAPDTDLEAESFSP